MIRRVTCTGVAVIVSAVMLLSGSGGSFAYAASEDVSYEFDYAKSATAQLEDLFTTIDIMDATAAGLSDEMEKGNVTSEQLVQMYIDRIQAYDRAAAVDRSDPYAVYDAACDLAKAYDKTVAALKASGLNLAKAKLTLSKTKYAYTGKKRTPAVTVKVGGVTLVQKQDYNVAYRNNLNAGTASVLITPASANYAGSKTARFTIGKGKTTFKVKASKKKIKVTSLSKGSSKVRFSVKKVTNGQKSKVKINSRTGKITLKKKTKKCTIYVKATSKANKNRKAGTKTVKIVVR